MFEIPICVKFCIESFEELSQLCGRNILHKGVTNHRHAPISFVSISPDAFLAIKRSSAKKKKLRHILLFSLLSL